MYVIYVIIKHLYLVPFTSLMVFPGGSDSQETACNVGDLCSIPGSGRFPGEENSYPLQYSCLENSTDRRAWQDIVHGVSKTSSSLLLDQN